MACCLSCDVEPVGIGKAAGVSVCGHEERQDELLSRDFDAGDLGISCCYARQSRHDSGVAEGFLDRIRKQVEVSFEFANSSG